MPQKYGHIEIFFSAHLCLAVSSALFQGQASCAHSIWPSCVARSMSILAPSSFLIIGSPTLLTFTPAFITWEFNEHWLFLSFRLFGISRGQAAGFPNLLGSHGEEPEQVRESGTSSQTPRDPSFLNSPIFCVSLQIVRQLVIIILNSAPCANRPADCLSALRTRFETPGLFAKSDCQSRQQQRQGGAWKRLKSGWRRFCLRKKYGV